MSNKRFYADYIFLFVGSLIIAIPFAFGVKVPERTQLIPASGEVTWSSSSGRGATVNFRLAGIDRVFILVTRDQRVSSHLTPAFRQQVSILFEPTESGRQEVWELRHGDQLVLGYDEQARNRTRGERMNTLLGGTFLATGGLLLAWQSRKRRSSVGS